MREGEGKFYYADGEIYIGNKLAYKNYKLFSQLSTKFYYF